MNAVKFILTIMLIASPAAAFERVGYFAPERFTDRDDWMLTTHKWQTFDTIMEGVFILLVLADWNQTLQFTKDGKREQNPILGSHPSPWKVNTLIPLGIIAHAGVAYVLPRPFRTIWQTVFIAVEYSAVEHNKYCGINVQIGGQIIY